jgi:hypothetical protein
MRNQFRFLSLKHSFLFGMVMMSVLLMTGNVQGQRFQASETPPPGPVQPIQPPSDEMDRYRNQATMPAGVQALADHTLADLDVGYISRTPAFAYDGAQKWPNPGQMVTFTGHIANRGGQASGAFNYRWSVDGLNQPLQNNGSLNPGQETTLTFTWQWQSGDHLIRLTLDPSDQIGEFSKTNNSVEDRTNAITLGVYVDQAFYDFFNANVWKSGWGGNSYDDWIQRHVNLWNQMFAGAVHPLTPNGIVDRIRLGKVVVVPNGGTHCNTNYPADDKEIDLIWGFLSEGVGVDGGCPGWTAAYRDNQALWDHDNGLIHELNHARYLIDLYGLNVDAHPNHLASAVNNTTTSLPLVDLPDIPEYKPPYTLVVDGEIVVCSGKSGNTATGCLRGQANTTPRAHAANAPVFADKFLITDGLGNALVGDAAMPVSGWMFYYEPYHTQDIMDSGPGYGEHSAYAWNRIAGQRAKCGNANAPCNIGEYLNEIPSGNILELHWPGGEPIDAGIVEVYRPRPFPIWYGQSFIGTPDLTLYTDKNGRVDLGTQPFGPEIRLTYGEANPVLLIKVVAGGQIGTLFFDITSANFAYWQGSRTSALYPVTLTNFRAYPPAAPTADFSGGPFTGMTPVDGQFSVTSTSGTITRYAWDFGDGQTGTGPSVTHHFTRPGVYDVSLAVFGPNGGSRVTKTSVVSVDGWWLAIPYIGK